MKGKVLMPHNEATSREVVLAAEGSFIPLVSRAWYAKKTKQLEVAFLTNCANPVLIVLFGGMIPFVGGIGFSSPWTVGVPLIGAAAFIAGSSPLIIKQFGWRRQMKAARAMNAAALDNWLNMRYHISATPEVLADLTKVVSWHFPKETSYDFNVGAKTFSLIAKKDNFVYVIEKKVFSLEEAAPSEICSKVDVYGKTSYDSVVLEDSVSWDRAIGRNMKGEAKLLFESVSDRLDTLRVRNLDINNRHVVARAENDLLELIKTHDELLSLVPEDKDSSFILTTLSALNIELYNILIAEVAAVRTKLSVQAEYVKGRQFQSELILEVSPSSVLPLPNSSNKNIFIEKVN